MLLRKLKGFTIVEMIVVLIILTILGILITPAVQVYYAQNRLKGAAEGLYDDMLMARTSAIQTSAATTITFNTATWCYGISSITAANPSSTCDCTAAASTSNCNLGIVSGSNFPNTSLATTISGTATTFDAVRATPNNTGTVTLSTTSGSTQSIKLTLSALGTTTLCSGSGGVGNVGGYAACP